MNINKKEYLFTVNMSTGYAGEDAEEQVVFAMTDEEFDEFRNKDCLPLHISQDCMEMARVNAESYGSDIECCTECDACNDDREDECENWQNSERIDYGVKFCTDRNELVHGYVTYPLDTGDDNSPLVVIENRYLYEQARKARDTEQALYSARRSLQQLQNVLENELKRVLAIKV